MEATIEGGGRGPSVFGPRSKACGGAPESAPRPENGSVPASATARRSFPADRRGLRQGPHFWYFEHVRHRAARRLHARQAAEVTVRPLADVDIEAITIDEKVTGKYRPDFWEDGSPIARRDPRPRGVAELDGKVVGFMLADVRGGEFGLEETSGWIERFGVDPAIRGRGIGRKMFEALMTHFRGVGAHRVRTFVDTRQTETATFLKAVGFGPSALTALEISLDR
jgi:GNAT superfamily N-acetyltransferase